MARRNSWVRFGLVVLLAVAPVAGSATLPAPAAHAQADGSAVAQTKEIVNYGDGTTREAGVRVSQTADLFDRQQVEVDLSGFKPSGNVNNAEEGQGSNLEYPVVVMQCHGADPDPRNCLNRHRWRYRAGFDVRATAEERATTERQRHEADPTGYPGADLNEKRANMLRAAKELFVGADGVRYLWDPTTTPDGEPLINEPTLKSFAPTDVTWGSTTTRGIPIRQDGTNEFLVEVRQRDSQPSLGCTDTQACSLVFVPIMDLACVEGAPADCTAGPVEQGEPGFNEYLSMRMWFAESNWRNRFVVPISFAPDLESCDVRDPRPTVPAYGSELVDVAQQRWGAAYCTGDHSSDYLPVYTQGGEYEARRQFNTRFGDQYQQDAVFTTQPVTGSPRPVAHAPSALTGFSVAYTVDDANGSQVYDLTLSPRLLAKLLTQSYNPVVVAPHYREGKRLYDGTQQITSDAEANEYYVAHPHLLDNPRSLLADPEFVALNPGIDLTGPDGGLDGDLNDLLNPVMFTVESDIVLALTRYVTSDPEARAWLDGQPDRWGMRVNPAWQGMSPTQLYSLQDQWVRTPQPRKPNWTPSNNPRWFVRGGGDTCDERFATPYLTRLANITNSAESAATALLDRRGSATPNCSKITVPGEVVYEEDEKDPENFGERAMLAVTTAANAELYEVPSAKLVNASGHAVAPTEGTMLAGLNAAVQDRETGTIRIDHTRVTGPNAYPGTMVSFLAAPTSGLDRAVAGRYADYIEFMATTGQTPGNTLANLPPGYDPLPPNLRQQALDAARAVREQRGEVPTPPAGGPLGGGGPGGAEGLSSPGASDGTGADDGEEQPAGERGPGDGDAATEEGDPERVAQTDGEQSWLARWMFAILLCVALLAATAAGAVQLMSRPDHPVRRVTRSVVRSVVRR